jgi:predicted XRE-type DNA-binding protein
MLRKLPDNIFAHFGIEDATELHAKMQAVIFVKEEMERRGLIAAELARASGLSESNLSEILRFKFERYSIERLNKVLAVVGKKVFVTYRLDDVGAAAPVEKPRSMFAGREAKQRLVGIKQEVISKTKGTDGIKTRPKTKSSKRAAKVQGIAS